MGYYNRIFIVSQSRYLHHNGAAHGEFAQHIFAHGKGEPHVRQIHDGHHRTALTDQLSDFRKFLTHFSVARGEEVSFGFGCSHFFEDAIHACHLCFRSGFILLASSGKGHVILAPSGTNGCDGGLVLRLYLIAFLRADDTFVKQSLHAFITLAVDLFTGFGFLVQLISTGDLFPLRTVVGFLVHRLCHLTCS